ncbi:MAG: DUF4132 domain-containing protein [Clostridiales bacterium]|nr:DUF4132 domain-containing protein [Clostridiales bacterium]
MELSEKVRNLSGAALDEFSRSLYERDTAGFKQLLVELTRSHTMQSYQTVAVMMNNVPLKARGKNNSFAGATKGVSVYDAYFNEYLNACAECGCHADDYMRLLLSAQYADKSSPLFGWDESVDRYIDDMAREDFDRAAYFIDKYDKKYRKYSILVEVDRVRAINRLLEMALYGKKIDKSAVRDVLMDYDMVTDALMTLYGKSSAHERVSIVRLLLAFKSDVRVKRFLDEIVANDTSKSVREAAAEKRKTKNKENASAYFERLMAEGTPLELTEWKELLLDKEYRAIAENIFFYCMTDSADVKILLYDKGHFIDKNDRPFEPKVTTFIYVMHPLDVPSLGRFDIIQPFLQVNRPIYSKADGEGYYTMRLAGTMILRDEFYANMKKYGFVFADKRSDADPDTAISVLNDYAVAIECDLPTSSDTVSCGKISFFRTADLVKIRRKTYLGAARPVDIALIPRRTFSELIYGASKLFANV